MSIFDDIAPTDADADRVKSSTHYDGEIEPDEAERHEPLTEDERKALNDSLETVQGESPFKDVVYDDRPLGDWIPPRVKDARRRAQINVESGHIKRLEDQIFEITKHDALPDELADAVAAARAAIAKAYDARQQAAHPDAPGKVKSPAAKQAAVDALEAARAAVRDAQSIAARPDIREEQRAALVADIAPSRERAAESLDEAVSAFTHWQNCMQQVRDLDVANGEYGPDWHSHPDERSIGPRKLVGDLRRARDLANTDDPYLSGEYLSNPDLVPDGEVPPWTMRKLEKAAQIAGGGSYAQSLLMRVKGRHKADHPVRDALIQKDLRVIAQRPIPTLLPEK